MADDDVVGRVVSGATWEQFCDALKAAGKEVLRPETPATELDRAEGWRYLTRLTRVALEMMLEHGDPDFPVFYQASNTTLKIGADNPDNVYWNATIAGDREYRLRGTRGTVKYLSFATNANRYAVDGTLASTGSWIPRTSRSMPTAPSRCWSAPSARAATGCRCRPIPRCCWCATR